MCSKASINTSPVNTLFIYCIGIIQNGCANLYVNLYRNSIVLQY